MLSLLLVLVGGATGAVARFLTDRAVTDRAVTGRAVTGRAVTGRAPGPMPWGTLVVNVAGSLLFGVLGGAGATLPGWLGTLVGTGFCGALTTYSTFSYETFQLAMSGRVGQVRALLNVVLTLGLGLAAAAIGWSLAR